jgi:hypothetical protein
MQPETTSVEDIQHIGHNMSEGCKDAWNRSTTSAGNAGTAIMETVNSVGEYIEVKACQAEDSIKSGAAAVHQSISNLADKGADLIRPEP